MVDKKIFPRLSRNMLESSFLDLSLPSLSLLDCCWFVDAEEPVWVDDDDDVVDDDDVAATVENGLIEFPIDDLFNWMVDKSLQVDDTS